MRLLLYNIRYGTGPRHLLPMLGYLQRTDKRLVRIAEYIESQHPDIVGLLEVDGGSFRSGRINQARFLAERLGHYHCYESKYAVGGLGRMLPVLNKQGNAFLCRDSISSETFHFFQKGMKRLVIELELDDVVIFLVHLALPFRIRHHQLDELYSIVTLTNKPYLIAGDFNALWGERELKLFMAACSVRHAETEGSPTYPSWRPKRRLDFVLYSRGIEPRACRVQSVSYSDHLPLVFDFETTNGSSAPLS